MLRFSLTFSLLLLLAAASSLQAQNWPNWRGPDFNGVSTAKNTPVKWDQNDNVLWKVKLPGPGASTPITWGDNVFITCGIAKEGAEATAQKVVEKSDKDKKDGKAEKKKVDRINTVLCYDLKGNLRWQVAVGDEKEGKHKKASGSNPSACTDGKHLFVYFKSGDLAAIDFDGKIVWHHNVQEMYGKDTLWWDLGTSPVLTKNDVVIAVMQTGPSYLAAFDKATGKLHWKQDRDLGAPEEAAQSYSTPVVIQDNGNEVLVVLGADHVTAHDAKTGSELWRVGGLNPTNHKYFRSISSAVVSDGIVVAPYARGATVTAIKLGGSGDITKSHIVWVKEGLGADVPTPVAVDGKTFVCTDKGKVTCLDVKTGNEIWSGSLPANRNAFSASPILADGKIYLTREDGTTFVIAQNEFKVLAENALEGEFVVATPVFADGRVYIRTFENFYCFGANSGTKLGAK